MAVITLRPDLKTVGGEVTELLLDGRFVGTMSLVYREGGRISGSVQLILDSLYGSRKEEAVKAAQNYVENLTDALDAWDCEVIVTCSDYDQIITAGPQVGIGAAESFADDTDMYELVTGEEGDDRLDDIDPEDNDSIEMYAFDEGDEVEDSLPFELAIVGESRNRVEYHLYDRDKKWAAEAFVRINGADIYGEVDWKLEPSDEELEAAVNILVSDFDPDEIDTFWIEMIFAGDVIETIELTHEDLLEEDEANKDELFAFADNRGYSVILVRDDGDTLTYDLFEKNRGGLPIGQATVDLSSRELTGYIDFRDDCSPSDREMIGSLLMRELDKEQDYESLNLTMLVNNEPIDEIWFESEMMH